MSTCIDVPEVSFNKYMKANRFAWFALDYSSNINASERKYVFEVVSYRVCKDSDGNEKTFITVRVYPQGFNITLVAKGLIINDRVEIEEMYVVPLCPCD